MDRIIEVKEEPRFKVIPDNVKYPHLALRFTPTLTPLALMDLALIQPYSEEIAKRSEGEYSFYNVRQEVFTGGAFLYMGYAVKTEEDVKTLEDPRGGDVEDKDFAGFVIMRFDRNLPTAHIWQVYITPKYQNTNILNLGLDKVDNMLRENFRVTAVTLSSIREGWHDKAPKLGFKETFTLYRKKLEG